MTEEAIQKALNLRDEIKVARAHETALNSTQVIRDHLHLGTDEGHQKIRLAPSLMPISIENYMHMYKMSLRKHIEALEKSLTELPADYTEEETSKNPA